MHPCLRDPILPPFWQRSSDSTQKTTFAKIRYRGDKRSLLDLETIRYALALARKKICLSRWRSVSTTQLQDPQTNSRYVKRHATSTWDSKWESRFYIIKFLTPHSAILESIPNGKSRKGNIGDIYCLADPLCTIETVTIFPPLLGRKNKFAIYRRVPAQPKMAL